MEKGDRIKTTVGLSLTDKRDFLEGEIISIDKVKCFDGSEFERIYVKLDDGRVLPCLKEEFEVIGQSNMVETNVLDLKFYSKDLGKNITIRQFFFELMEKLWLQQECFNSKRPFGNSSWDSDLIVCLIKNNLIKGELDEDEYINKYDNKEVDEFVISKILKPLFGIS
jgi:hypothetical protein